MVNLLLKESIMAGIKIMGGKWYARIRFGKNAKNPFNTFEKLIPLGTNDEFVAIERSFLVNKVEKDYKKGIEYEFPWSSKTGTMEIKRLTLEEAVNKWEKYRLGKVANNTFKTNQYGLKYLIGCLGHSIPLKNINNKDIDKYKESLINKDLSNTSINIHLRTVKAMFSYYKKMNDIDKIPLIEQIKVKKTQPKYITDDEFNRILSLNHLDRFYKRVFYFYRETGMRLREPMMSSLNGDWIDIPNSTKSGSERNIPCNNRLKDIFIEFQNWYMNGYGSSLKDCGDHLSKKFKYALRAINGSKQKSFHSLRHTFAVRHILKGTYYNDLRLMMGHSSIETTEVYINMNLKRVAQDFPDIIRKPVVFNEFNQEWDIKKWDKVDSYLHYLK